MELPVIYVFTHDSIGVGEDGPTHQPIEQLAVAARDSRPARDPAGRRQRGRRGLADGDRQLRHQPAVLVLTRQTLPTLDRTQVRLGRAAGQGRLRPGRRAGRQARRHPDRHRQRGVAVRGRRTRSSPPRASRPASSACRAGRCSRPGPGLSRQRPAAVGHRARGGRAGLAIGWDRYAGRTGIVLGMRSFGMSAPIAAVAEHFGFTVEHVVAAAKQAIAGG